MVESSKPLKDISKRLLCGKFNLRNLIREGRGGKIYEKAIFSKVKKGKTFHIFFFPREVNFSIRYTTFDSLSIGFKTNSFFPF